MTYADTLMRAAGLLDQEWAKTTAKVTLAETDSIRDDWEDLARALALGAEALRKTAQSLGVRA